jgi:uridine phosphorylase
MKKLLMIFALFSLMNIQAAELETQSIGDPKGTNFPMDAEGRVYHLGLKRGEIANRILLVGDPDRAKLIRLSLDNPEESFAYASNRGFTTYTGTKHGKPVTIMAIGMGLPMMDFAIREIRAITDGPLSIIRLGSCGTPRTDIPIGTVVVADQSYGIITDYDAYHQSPQQSPFLITKPLHANLSLHQKLIECLKINSSDSFPVMEAIDATADSFYGSQGRIDSKFDDRNGQLIDQILEKYPQTGSLQMETFHLYHLAKLNSYAEKQEMIRVAACAIVLAQRKSDDFLSNALKHAIEIKAGNACLEALIAD